MAKRAVPMRASPAAAQAAAASPPKASKLVVWLVTTDDALWPAVSAELAADMTARQFDSLDELIAGTPAGQNAVVLWDARGAADAAAALTRLQVHSTRLAVVAMETAGSAAEAQWHSRQQQQQVAAVLGLPALGADIGTALDLARDEAGARRALLGDSPAVGERRRRPRVAAPAMGRPSWLPFAAGGVAFAALAGAAAFWWMRPTATTPTSAPTPAPGVPTAGGGAAGTDVGAAAGPSSASDDRAFALIDKAQQAMVARHFIDPMEGSALSLYREALVLDPANGEARQGLQRIEEILVARAQSALEERKLDVALQSLETARSIDADDARLKALDGRLAGLRAELGPAQIQAAIAAQAFDRATQLIDEAARAKLLPAAKLAQLREEVKHQEAEQGAARLSTLIEARLAQDRLIDPARDSALYYLTQARGAGGEAGLGAQWQEFFRRATLAAHAAIDQHRFSDADRWVGELRSAGLGVAPLAALQRDLAAARAALPTLQNKPVTSPFVDEARARLASGNVLEPEGDSALYYVTQLRNTDPQNPALPQLASVTQSQVLDRARAALDAGQLSRAETMIGLAAGLGPSADGAALDARLQSAKAAQAAPHEPPTVAEATLTHLNALTLDYPVEARRKEQAGWVEVAYTVSAEGKVSQAHVLNSSPPGVFDAAAVKAISHLKYQPPQVDGKAASVTTALRLVFRFQQ